MAVKDLDPGPGRAGQDVLGLVPRAVGQVLNVTAGHYALRDQQWKGFILTADHAEKVSILRQITRGGSSLSKRSGRWTAVIPPLPSTEALPAGRRAVSRASRWSEARRAVSPEASTPVVSVIVPTYNETENIRLILARLREALTDHAYEIVVVDDDSEDETWRVAEALARSDRRIRVIRRTAERGLSSAVLTGMAAAAGRTMVVIDADLQHDETKIPDLVSAVEGGADICLGTRQRDGGSYGSFKKRRRLMSWTGAALARMVLGLPVSDPMSGFFAVSRDRFDLVVADVNPRGFKILLEFLARGPRPVVSEVGYRFGERRHGTTKLNGSVVIAYLAALRDLSAAQPSPSPPDRP